MLGKPVPSEPVMAQEIVDLVREIREAIERGSNGR